VQSDRVPGVSFVGVKQAGQVREGGNLIWGLKEGPQLQRDVFAKFRASPLFEESRKAYAPGWTTHDRVSDPKFVRLASDRSAPADVRLLADSPAVNGGLPIPAEWLDPLRDSDRAEPDSGALPHGAQLWGVGVGGRIPLFGESRGAAREAFGKSAEGHCGE
jgi:hypothetical protein